VSHGRASDARLSARANAFFATSDPSAPALARVELARPFADALLIEIEAVAADRRAPVL